MKTSDLEIRRQVMQCKIGKIGRLTSPSDEHDAVILKCENFARAKLIKLEFKIDGDLIKMRKAGDLLTALKYGEVDGLKVGESHLFKVPESQHQNIRSNMVYRTKKNGRVYRCTVEPDGLLVTRVLPVNDNQDEFMLNTKVARETKYGLERLIDVPSVIVNIERFEHDRVRLAAHRLSVRHGFDVSCRVQKDGTMLVTRVQAPPEGSGDVPRTTKADPYDLARLESTDKILINLPKTEVPTIRVAVHRYAQKTGWTIRARLQDDGSMLVYRTDAGATPAATPAK